MAKMGKHGVSQNTPKNIVFGACTVHIGLKYESGKWNGDETIVGATNGGSKLVITPEITKLEVDGALVAAKGLTRKTGEVANLEIQFAEVKGDILKRTTLGEVKTSEVTGYELLESKPNIEAGDYVDNIALVGKTEDGEDIIAILDNALCTSGLELDTKHKEQAVIPATFECHGDPEGDLDTLPWHIYYPTRA